MTAQDDIKELLNWYSLNMRQLPWRQTSDPYAIWISEIMLQQTRVETVLDYYLRFLAAFPDVLSLAEAHEQEVLALWKGLGYYTRARNLHQSAKIIAEKYRGEFPAAYSEIRSLPGIGDYTAGAIASIAFNQPYPAVDGNVLRVMARYQGIEEDISKLKVKKQIEEITASLIPKGEAGKFTQALMELGATCCLPLNPACDRCPLQKGCRARLCGKHHLLPVKKKAKAPLDLEYWVALIVKDGNILMEQRLQTQMLGNMWGLPMIPKNTDTDPVESLELHFSGQVGLSLQFIKSLGVVKHIFTHQAWHMEVILFTVDKGNATEEPLRSQGPQLAWITPESRKTLPVPKVFQKVIDRLTLNGQINIEWTN